MSLGRIFTISLIGSGSCSPSRPPGCSSDRHSVSFSTTDAFVILLASMIGGVGYQLAAGYPTTDILPYCAVGLLASFIHILRMSGSGYYDFADSAKPRCRNRTNPDLLVYDRLAACIFCFSSENRDRLFARRICDFYFLAPVGLLGARKITKTALVSAVSRGTVGRRDVVLIGDFNEIAALESRDLLAFFGAADVNRFTLSARDDPLGSHLDRHTYDQSGCEFCARAKLRGDPAGAAWGDAGRLEFFATI